MATVFDTLELAKLFKFYQVNSIEELVFAQDASIKRLQDRVQYLESFQRPLINTNVRA